MCGRVFVRRSVPQLLAAFAEVAHRHKDDGFGAWGPRYNGSPGQDYPIIVREPDAPGGMFIRARWGFVPAWQRDPNPKLKPINATCEKVATSGMFRAAYRSRRALLPIDGFFEWRAIKGAKAKQPYAIAMRDGSPFALAAIWERWRKPDTGEDINTFAVVTCPANELVGQIHDRMPVIVAPADYTRWISDAEPDPRDLLKPYPSGLMTLWPISTRVNAPRNDDSSLLDPIDG